MPDLTFFRDVNVADLDAGDTFIDGDDLFYVDEVRSRIDELELLGYTGDRRTGKRVGRQYPRFDPLPDVRAVPDIEAEARLVDDLSMTPLGKVTGIDNGAVVGWSAQIGETRWRVMVLAVKPPSWGDQDTAKSFIAADSIDVDEAPLPRSTPVDGIRGQVLADIPGS
jgi:hypothetical protein